MRGYQTIQENGKWFFELIPNNNNNQPVGRSKEYRTERECRKAVKDFGEFVLQNEIGSESSPFVVIEKELYNNIPHYRFQYILNDEVIFYRTIAYQSKENCQKAIASIYEHIESYVLNEVEERCEIQ